MNKHRAKKQHLTNKIKSYIALLFYTLIILIPLYVIFITSFKANSESTGAVFTWWPKQGFHFDGYWNVLFNDLSGGGRGISSILRGFVNTMLIVVPTTLFGIFFSALSGYSFAKINFRFKNTLFSLLMLTMMIPSVIMLTPSYLIYDNLGLTDTFFPLMAPAMLGSAGCVFFMRQYYFGIPTDLIEAAKIDGLGHIKIFFKIMVPLSKSALIAQGVLGFVAGYNDYFGPLLYLNDPDKYTLQIALKFCVSTYGYDWQTVMAGSVVALLPTIVIYVFAQRYFVEGIATSGLKV